VTAPLERPSPPYSLTPRLPLTTSHPQPGATPSTASGVTLPCVPNPAGPPTAQHGPALAQARLPGRWLEEGELQEGAPLLGPPGGWHPSGTTPRCPPSRGCPGGPSKGATPSRARKPPAPHHARAWPALCASCAPGSAPGPAAVLPTSSANPDAKPYSVSSPWPGCMHRRPSPSATGGLP
jgi:hypothetical protein